MLNAWISQKYVSMLCLLNGYIAILRKNAEVIKNCFTCKSCCQRPHTLSPGPIKQVCDNAIMPHWPWSWLRSPGWLSWSFSRPQLVINANSQDKYSLITHTGVSHCQSQQQRETKHGKTDSILCYLHHNNSLSLCNIWRRRIWWRGSSWRTWSWSRSRCGWIRGLLWQIVK